MASILIADDLKDLSETLKRGLEVHGHSVTTSSDGNLAVKALAKSPFDLVVLDIHMPGTDGLEVIRQMKVAGHRAKILAMSGGGKTGDFLFLEVAEKLGASASLRKPEVGR